jgi:(2S)-methylsuccinyl-CoA dehydrogenase
MTSTQTASPLAAAATLAVEAERLVGAAIARAAELTAGGARIDDHQVLCERLAAMATEARAASALVEYAQRLASSGRSDALAEEEALAYSAEVLHRIVAARDARPGDFAGAPPLSDDTRELLRDGLADARIREIGARTIESRGATNVELDDADAAQTRAFTRQFARSEVLKEEDGVALADRIHREDMLVPETLIKQYSELGFFGSSIPEEFGGTGMGYLTMTVLTEELSTASLVAGSLLTRSEILSRALLEGGTDAQKRAWLPRLASGDVIVGVSVTEPDVGSDVASAQCRATPAEQDGRMGWLINGQKAWCTFGGRANVLALLARTDPDVRKGYNGLSLFIVEKDPFPGHKFEQTQPAGETSR